MHRMQDSAVMKPICFCHPNPRVPISNKQANKQTHKQTDKQTDRQTKQTAVHACAQVQVHQIPQQHHHNPSIILILHCQPAITPDLTSVPHPFGFMHFHFQLLTHPIPQLPFIVKFATPNHCPAREWLQLKVSLRAQMKANKNARRKSFVPPMVMFVRVVFGWCQDLINGIEI